jgi:hypothetical protein|tara:strand:+ start:1435 stop:2646 length:1212 start_codon:yes stop_codon:yes gene_type:complete
MYEILTGKKRSLVFPIMCNAFVKMDYSENIPDTGSDGDTSNDTAYGFWSHEGSFTFQSIITPYEINGNGTYQNRVNLGSTSLGIGQTRLDSKKIMPNHDDSLATSTTLQDLNYLSRANRLSHEMMIFNNDNFKVSLLNDTTHAQNQPAEYKIKVQVKIGSTTKTVTTNKVIVPSQGHVFRYNSTNGADLLSGFDENGRVMYAKVAEVSSHSAGSASITTSSATHPIVAGDKQEIFIRDGFTFTSLGTVNSVSSTTLTLTSAYSTELTSGTDIFLPTYKHASYIDQQFHIGCIFNNTNKVIQIFLNGVLITSDTHSETSNFSFAKTDTYLGSNGLNDMSVSGINDLVNGGTATGPNAATTCKQFMGEFHELSIENKISNFAGIDNLLPNYDNTLLYLTFEEVDE